MSMGIARAGAVLAALHFLAGCGSVPDQAGVRGKVMLDGKPLEKGTMSFFPADGKGQSTGCEIKDGAYAAQVALGVNQVKISAPRVIGAKALYPDDPKSPKMQVTAEALPPQYNQESTLQVDVKPGTNEKDFDLRSQ